VLMMVVTATNPLFAYDGKWFSRLRSGEVTQTIVNHMLYPYSGWLPIIPFFAGGLLAATLAARSVQFIRISRADAITAVAAFASWLVLSIAASRLSSGSLLPLALAFAAVITILALKALTRSEASLQLRPNGQYGETPVLSGD